MSENNSDDEIDGQSNFIPYSRRPEWSDVQPIEQDDGPHPVVKIAYSDDFRDIFNYFRACIKSQEISERVLQLTSDAVRKNPANYTVWCYRRQVLDGLRSDLKAELKFIGSLIRDNPKNYQVWEHRRLIVERSGHADDELPFIAEILRLDSKNYHAWQYRQWVLKTYGLWANELDYVNNLLVDDIRNNSAWNQRYFVIAHTTGFKDDIVESELEYVERRIEFCPDNESAWNYLRGIARFRSTDLKDQRLWRFCQNLYENHFEKDEFHPQQWRFLLAFMVDLLMNDDFQGKVEDNQNKINDLCEKLISKVDPIRRKYWQYIREQKAVA